MSGELRTEDEVARLFADANPIPNHARSGSERGAVADVTNRGTKNDVMIDLDEPTKPVTRQRHQPRWLLLAAAAAALVVTLGVATWSDDDQASVDESNTVAPEITTPDTLPPPRLDVVEDFAAALSAHDVAALSRILAPGFIPALAPGADVGVEAVEGPASLEDQLAWLDAFGWTSELSDCRLQGDGAYCRARERNRLADLVPLEIPVTMRFGFEDGRIDQLVLTREFDRYGPEAFLPFYEWTLDNHPDDVERLWTPASSTVVLPILTPSATELMDARLTEYISAQADAAPASEADVNLAGAFIQAFNDRDAPALGSLVADPQTFFVYFDASDPDTYFAWLDAFDWRWEEPACADDGEVVVCPVDVRNKLTDASGVERRDVIRFSMADGLVEDVSMVYNSGDYWIRAYQPFIEWVAATYPDDLRTMWTFERDDISPILNDTSIQLFAAHLDEWSSSDALPTPAHRAFLDAQAGGDVEEMRGLLAPDAVVDQLWASTAEELPGLSRLLTGVAWDWSIKSCSISSDDPDPVRPRIACVADPTWRLDDGGIGVAPMFVEFELTSAGIASVATGSLEPITENLGPLFDWIRTAHPDEAGSLLAERDGMTVPVLSDAAVDQLLELIDEFLAADR